MIVKWKYCTKVLTRTFWEELKYRKIAMESIHCHLEDGVYFLKARENALFRQICTNYYTEVKKRRTTCFGRNKTSY